MSDENDIHTGTGPAADDTSAVAAAAEPVAGDPAPVEPVADADLASAIEAVLFVLESPVPPASLAAALQRPVAEIERALGELREGYDRRGAGIELREVGEGVRIYTRPDYAPYVEQFLRDGQRARLSQAALETLAVIAYRQPVTRSRVAAIRGVNVDGVVRTLLTRGLIVDVGTESESGGTLLQTTELFLEKVGMRSLEELPSLAPLLPELDAMDGMDAISGTRGAREIAARPNRTVRPDEQAAVSEQEGIRLQKVLAAAGIGSRRVCEDMIADGRVSVDGQVVTEQGMRVDPQVAVIAVDGLRINVREDLVYVALNKPRGVLSTMSDDRGRRTVADLLAERPERLFHVGRLDADSEGLLLLTNDGELAHKLMHPAFGVPKTYLATVPGPVPRAVGARLRAGVELDDGPVKVDAFRVVQSQGDRAIVEVVLHEGRKHIVRRLLAEVGHPVQRLVRTQIGPVRLGNLRAGEHRELTRTELGELFAATGAAR